MPMASGNSADEPAMENVRFRAFIWNPDALTER